MAFIDTVPALQAEGEVREMYVRQQARYGYVPAYATVFSHRPELMALWAQLLAGIRRHIAPREFELATLTTAHVRKNSPCSLAHGRALRQFLSDDDIIAIVGNIDTAEIPERDKSLVRFARKAAADASQITEQDVNALRDAGFSDTEIFDIAMTIAARAFFTTLLDTLGVQPDATAASLDVALRDCLSVGRTISNRPLERLLEL